MALITATLAKRNGSNYESILTSYDDTVMNRDQFETLLKDNYNDLSVVQSLIDLGNVEEVKPLVADCVATGTAKQVHASLSSDESELKGSDLSYIVDEMQMTDGSPVVMEVKWMRHDPVTNGWTIL